ncbi:MAG: hypothetical protein PHX51_02775 [Clostridia bacterium]|nr:hypothetical protein [Clostridia bacterium]
MEIVLSSDAFDVNEAADECDSLYTMQKAATTLENAQPFCEVAKPKRTGLMLMTVAAPHAKASAVRPKRGIEVFVLGDYVLKGGYINKVKSSLLSLLDENKRCVDLCDKLQNGYFVSVFNNVNRFINSYGKDNFGDAELPHYEIGLLFSGNTAVGIVYAVKRSFVKHKNTAFVEIFAGGSCYYACCQNPSDGSVDNSLLP